MSGRTGLLADLASLAAILCYDRWICGGPRRDGLFAFACFGLALLTKESSAVLPFVLAALEWMRGGHSLVRTAAVRLLPYVALAVLYVGFEFWILRVDSAVVGSDFALGFHLVRNFGEYFARMVLPVTPSSMLVAAPKSLAPILGFASAALSIVAPLGVIALALWRNAPRAARFGAIWAMISILPYLALTFRTSTRYLYGPAQGMAVVAGALALVVLERAARRSPAVERRTRVLGTWGLVALIVVQFCVLAFAMEKRRAQQVEESGPAQERLETLARDIGLHARSAPRP
jgi:hypothetical protein